MTIHTQDKLVASTKEFMAANPVLIKRQIQIGLAAQDGALNFKQLQTLATLLYDRAKDSPDSTLGFGPFFGLTDSEPQWELRISVGSQSVKLLCGIDSHTGVYMSIDEVSSSLRNRIECLLDAH